MEAKDLPTDNEVREIRVTGALAAYFGNPRDPLLLVGRALTSGPCYAHFGESFGHVRENGVSRHGRRIGGLEDIEILGVVQRA